MADLIDCNYLPNTSLMQRRNTAQLIFPLCPLPPLRSQVLTLILQFSVSPRLCGESTASGVPA